MTTKKLLAATAATSIAMLVAAGAVQADSAKLVNPTNGHAYQRFDTALNWNSAKNACISLGGHLATITTKSEKDWIHQNVYSVAPRPGGNNIFLGGEKAKNGPWQLITNETFSGEYWCPGEPNGNGLGDLSGYANLTMLEYSSDICFNDVDGTTDQYVYLCEWDYASCANLVRFTSGTPAKAAEVNENFDALNCQNQALNSQIQALKSAFCLDHPTASICQ